ncbi:MAG: beta-galactosidase [Candidatus Omnitrophica bacterium]|nr:beta-galactosidase [Candidatus Omnitrophota bacterium]
MIKRHAFKLMMLFSCVLLSSRAYTAEQDNSWQKLDPSFVTPHIPWAKPLAGKPLKVLVIAPTWTQRDTVELAQRLDITYDTLMSLDGKQLGNNQYAGTPFDPVIMDKELEEKLSKPLDVIILGKMYWTAIPRRYQLEILKKVHAGRGLLLVMPKELDEFMGRILNEKKVPLPNYITDSLPLNTLPAFTNYKDSQEAWQKTLQTAQLGAGRICILQYPRETPYGVFQGLTPSGYFYGNMANYEYYQALVARSVLWCASREPDIGLSVSSPQILNIDTEGIGRLKVVCILNNKGSRKNVSLRLVCRDEEGRIHATEESTPALPTGESAIEFAINSLPAGRFFIDATVSEQKKVVNWSVAPLFVTRQGGIARLDMDKQSFEQGETVSGKAEIKNWQPGDKLLLTLKDNLGRVMETQEIPAQNNISFTFEPVEALVILHSMEAQLIRGEYLVCRGKTEFCIRPQEKDDFLFFMWVHNYNEQPAKYYELQQLRRYGVDVAYLYDATTSKRSNEELLSGVKAIVRNNLQVVPYIIRIIFTGSPVEMKREPCLTDPAYRETVSRVLKNTGGIFASYFPAAYSLGDENALSAYNNADICLSPTCNEDFRKFLREKYGTLEELNRVWRTFYNSWDEVEPVLLTSALKTGYLIPWIDHRLHMDEVYTDIYRYSRDIIRQFDPKAKVGFEGGLHDSTWGGADWVKLLDETQMAGSYFNPRGNEIIRSLSKPGTITGYWFGGYTRDIGSESRQRWHPWNNLFYGMNTVWWWMSTGFIGTTLEGPALRPDLTPFPGLVWAGKEVEEIKKGPYAIISAVTRLASGIAFYYNRLSYFTATAGSRTANFEPFVQLVKDSGLQGNVLSDRDILSGSLTPERYPVFIIPGCEILSDEIARTVADYLKAGGTVIADILPKLNTEGNPLSVPPFASLTEGTGEKQEVDFGKGKLIKFSPKYLSKYTFGHGSMPRSRDEEEDNALRQNFGALLQSAGVKRHLEMETINGEEIFDCEIFVWRNGTEEYAGIIRNPNMNAEPLPVKVTFLKKSHVYDIREKKFLGYRDTIELTLAQGEAKLYALLPEEEPAIAMSVDKGDDSFTIVLKSHSMNTKVAWLEVYDPDGKPVKYYCQTVVIKGGEKKVKIPLALNDIQGTWKVIAHDIISGSTDTSTFEYISRAQ